MKYVIVFLFAYFGSRLIFSLFNFSYNIISDPFDLTSFLIDIGVFVMLWILAELGFKKFAGRRQVTNS
ncbi:hypothetical protein A1QK_11890 [Vibrio genomosp. F10 str. 9ZD137]|nr:hypothetical protein A1QK_11890 [Vibrio genomosp. F10 str. 9ZD137]